VNHKHDYIYTGNTIVGKGYEYKCKCGKTIWLEHGEEAITEAPPEAKLEEEQQVDPKKRSSDYHKRRYQMIKKGVWMGHMP